MNENDDDVCEKVKNLKSVTTLSLGLVSGASSFLVADPCVHTESIASYTSTVSMCKQNRIYVSTYCELMSKIPFGTFHSRIIGTEFVTSFSIRRSFIFLTESIVCFDFIHTSLSHITKNTIRQID